MISRLIFLIFGVSVCLLAQANVTCDSTLNKEDLIKKLSDLVFSVIRISDNEIRGFAAREISRIIVTSCATETIESSDKIIDEIAGLLTDEDSGVVFSSAVALGSLGVRANRTLPALEAAAVREKQRIRPGFQPTVSTLAGINYAITEVRPKK